MRSAYREKLANDFWNTHLYLTRGDADLRAWAIDEAERLLRDLPSRHFSHLRDDALEGVKAARCGDADALDRLAHWVDIIRTILEREPKPRAPRKPSVSTLIEQARKASGKPVTSITTPEGLTLRFDQPDPVEAVNPWLADLDRVTKQ